MRKKNTDCKFAVMLVALLLTAMFAFSDAGAQVVPIHGGTLYLGMTAELKSWAPTAVASSNVDVWLKPASGLLNRWINGSLTPDLVTSYNMSSDGRKITMHLRNDVYWHDGVKYTSADTKFFFDKIVNTLFTASTWVGKIASVEAPDDYTVILNLNASAPWFETAFDIYCSAQLWPKHLYEGTDIEKNPYNMKPVGTGPFKFAEWKTGEYIRFVRNENYYVKGLPYLDEIVVRFYKDPSIMVLAFATKEIDAIPLYFPLEYSKMFADQPHANVQGYAQDTGAQELLAFDLQHGDPVKNEILNSLLVRQAVAHAINKTDLVVKAYYGLNVVSDNIFMAPNPSTEYWYYPNVKKYPYNVTLANSLLDEAGYPRQSTTGTRFGLELIISTNRIEQRDYAELVRTMLANVGIEVTVKSVDEATWRETVWMEYPHMWDLAFLPLRSGGPDPAFMNVYYGSRYGAMGVAWTNAMGYNNSRVDELLELGGGFSADQSQRKTYYDEVQVILNNELPLVPLMTKPRLTGYWDNVHEAVIVRNYGGSTGNSAITWKEATEETQSMAGWILPTVAVVVIALVIGVVSIVYLRKRKK